MIRHSLVSTFLAAMLFAATATAEVLVVDPTGAGDATEIGTAVLAAQDGDTILVRSGVYLPFMVDGKELRIIAAESALVQVAALFTNNGLVRIRVTDPSKSVVVRGIRAYYEILDSQGIVRFEDTRLLGGGATCSLSGGGIGGQSYVCGAHYPAARVTNSSRVEFVRCRIEGADGYVGDPFNPGCVSGGHGLVATNSQIVLYDSTLEGGAYPFSGVCVAGQDFVGDPAQLTIFNGPEDFVATSPLVTGQLGSLAIGGVPGDSILLLLSAKPGHLAIPPHSGVLMVAPPILGVFAIGTMPGSGTMNIPIAIHDLPPPGVEVVDLFLQPVLVGSSGIGKLAPPALLTVLRG